MFLPSSHNQAVHGGGGNRTRERFRDKASVSALVLLLALVLTPAAAASSRVPAFWQNLANCETGGRWDWGAHHRPAEGHTYEGGLGFYYRTWTLWASAVGVFGRYPHAYMAPPLVQVRVGRYGLAHHGYWGCLS